MKAYAVIQTGGKQYRVEPATVLEVERIDAQPGDRLDSLPVLAVSDGKELAVGKPHIEGARVTALVVGHKRGRKVVSFKKKRRKGYERKQGHRQELTVLKIESLA